MSIDRSLVELRLPAGVTVTARPGTVQVQGPLGRVERRFPSDALELTVAGTSAKLRLTLPANRRRAQALLRTWESHLKNLAAGVTRGVEAKMKIVAAHFPMKVSVKEHDLLIENFLGEKHPRAATLLTEVKAVVDGEFVLLSGIDIERVGQSTANVERATRIRNYDPRVFQDGIYLVEHAHIKEAA